MKSNKKVIIIFIALVFVCTILIFLSKCDYKILKFGNNLGNKSLEEIENYILNINSYLANIEVEVQSNKSNNKYIIKQEYCSPNISKQEVMEPTNIKGLTTSYNGAILQINNTDIQLTTIYENYNYIADNILWLNSFISDYKNSKENSIKEENGEVVLTVRVSKNKYTTYKKLYIDKNTAKPTKLIIEDENKKSRVYIKYTEIKINNTDKSELLAFKLNKMYMKDL